MSCDEKQRKGWRVSCDVGKATETARSSVMYKQVIDRYCKISTRYMGDSPGDVSEEPVT